MMIKNYWRRCYGLSKCKIRKNLSTGPRNPFYFNVAWFHLKRPRLKFLNEKGIVDGYPIIHVDTERMR